MPRAMHASAISLSFQVTQLSACAGALAAHDRDGLRVAQAGGRAASRGAHLARAGLPLWLHRAAGGALPSFCESMGLHNCLMCGVTSCPGQSTWTRQQSSACLCLGPQAFPAAPWERRLRSCACVQHVLAHPASKERPQVGSSTGCCSLLLLPVLSSTTPSLPGRQLTGCTIASP